MQNAFQGRKYLRAFIKANVDAVGGVLVVSNSDLSDVRRQRVHTSGKIFSTLDAVLVFQKAKETVAFS